MGRIGMAVGAACFVGGVVYGCYEFIDPQQGTSLSPACNKANMSFQDGLVVFPYNADETPYKGVDPATLKQSIGLTGKWAILSQPDAAILPTGTSIESFAEKHKLSAMALRCINGVGMTNDKFAKDSTIYLPRQTFTTKATAVVRPEDTLLETLTRACGDYKKEYALNPPRKLLVGMLVGANCKKVPSAASDNPPAVSPEAPRNTTLDKKTLSFVEKYSAYAAEAEKEYGVPKAVSLAMAINESGYGSSELSTGAHNFHGLKANSEWHGETYRKKTWEVVTESQLGDFTVVGSPKRRPDGKYDIYIVTDFKKFGSDRDGFLGFAEHLRTRMNGAAYRDAFSHSNDAFAFFSALFDGTGAKYGTDPTYIKKVGGNVRAIQSYVG
jgi:hypothetical protein